MNERGTGRTKAMVEALPESALVIVHTYVMRRYVERMTRDLRGIEFASRTRVVVIQNRCDADLVLLSMRGPVRFDHAWEQHVPFYVREYVTHLTATRRHQ